MLVTEAADSPLTRFKGRAACRGGHVDTTRVEQPNLDGCPDKAFGVLLCFSRLLRRKPVDSVCTWDVLRTCVSKV